MPSLSESRIAMGKWYRRKRKEAGYTVFGLASELKVSTHFIKKVETGYDPVPIKRLKKYSIALEIPPGEILSKLRSYEPEEFKEFEEIMEVCQHFQTAYPQGLVVSKS